MLSEAALTMEAARAKLEVIEATAKAAREEAMQPVKDIVARMDYALIPVARIKKALKITDHNTVKALYPEHSDKLGR